jgi:hypothetical protein
MSSGRAYSAALAGQAGIQFSGNNGTTVHMDLDTSGNLGLGVTPSAWGSSYKALQLQSGGLSAWALGGINGYLYSNAYYDGSTNRYVNTGTATSYATNNGSGIHAWFNAPSGTAGNAITFTQAMTLAASGGLSIGTTTDAGAGNILVGNGQVIASNGSGTAYAARLSCAYNFPTVDTYLDSVAGASYSGQIIFRTSSGGGAMQERARIDTSGNLLVGNTSLNSSANMLYWNRGGGVSGHLVVANTEVTNATAVLYLNREGSDGTLIEFRQANTAEGSISVSGTTVSYNGGHLSRWAQTTAPKDDTLVKGTVLSNLDAMNVYTKDGQPVENEQLNKVKVSDVEGDANVAGVFVNWSHDDVHNVDEINMAMTGDMIIRIAQGVTVVRGDLLMSAGDGTAKPQGDDIVRSKTVAKVTSTHVTCTYADGSYCVPCVLMAC